MGSGNPEPGESLRFGTIAVAWVLDIATGRVA
jgi:hypothetical protein